MLQAKYAVSEKQRTTCIILYSTNTQNPSPVVVLRIRCTTNVSTLSPAVSSRNDHGKGGAVARPDVEAPVPTPGCAPEQLPSRGERLTTRAQGPFHRDDSCGSLRRLVRFMRRYSCYLWFSPRRLTYSFGITFSPEIAVSFVKKKNSSICGRFVCYN